MELKDKEFYENLAGQALAELEVFEAKKNFVGFFDLLLQIDNRLNEQSNEYNNRSSDSAS